jgi:hypothetical protein
LFSQRFPSWSPSEEAKRYSTKLSVFQYEQETKKVFTTHSTYVRTRSAGVSRACFRTYPLERTYVPVDHAARMPALLHKNNAAGVTVSLSAAPYVALRFLWRVWVLRRCHDDGRRFLIATTIIFSRGGVSLGFALGATPLKPIQFKYPTIE